MLRYVPVLGHASPLYSRCWDSVGLLPGLCAVRSKLAGARVPGSPGPAARVAVRPLPSISWGTQPHSISTLAAST